MNNDRKIRIDKVNQLLMAIGVCGRRFFNNKGKFSRFEMASNGRIWYIDKWSGNRIYTHYPNWTSTHKITEGGTLKYMLKALKKYIMDGVPISHNHLCQWPKTMCDGDVWGYGNDMQLVQIKAEALEIWQPVHKIKTKKSMSDNGQQTDKEPELKK